MIVEQPTLETVEMPLRALARQHLPEGSTIDAIVDQWLLAMATKGDLYCDKSISSVSSLRKSIQRILREQFPSNTSQSLYDMIFDAIDHKPAIRSKFRFIDLFAGIGGVRLAFQNNGGSSIFSSEYDKSAQKTYHANYGENPFGDITKIPELNIPDHDILLAGFPCQPFSHAGVSARTSIGRTHGFMCEVQGTLFFDVLRIIAKKKPQAVFLENVRNIERHDSGRTFQVIKESLTSLGYSFQYQIINSSSVVPQRRIRCYMVAFRGDVKHSFNFPEFEGEPIALKTILEQEVNDIYTISDKLWQGHINRTKRNLERGAGFTAHTADLNKPSNTIVARYGKDGKECLIPQEGNNPRMLTPRECARLQGFPENFKIPAARTPAYKQFGNSVVVPVIDRIAKNIIKEIS